MSKVRKILIILLLVLPLLLSTGLASWIIINVKEDDNPPNYNYETIVENAFGGQDKDYTGEGLYPDPMYNGSINDEVIASGDFDFYYLSGSNWVKGFPTDSGTYSIKVVPKSIGDINKGVEITFVINKADQIVNVTGVKVTYDGKPHKLDESTVEVKFGNAEGLTITGNTPITDVGFTTVSIAVSGNSNFNPYNSTVKVEVIAKGINSSDVEGGVTTSYTYTGSEIKPSYSDITLTYAGMKLDSDDYEILSWSKNVNATNTEKATVTIKGKGNYDGQRTLEFDIAKANQVVSFSSGKTYDGQPANVTATTNKEVEDLNVQKTITYYDSEKNEITAPTYVGEYYVRVQIEGTDNYNEYDSDYVKYTISPLDISNVEIGSINDIKYTNSPITLPVPTIKFNSNDLIDGIDKDFTISYKDANGDVVTEIINDGTYYVVIEGHGNFTGTYDVEFKVVKNAIGSCSFDIKDLTYTGSELTPDITVRDGETVLTENVDYTLTYDTLLNADEYKVIIKGIGLYEGEVEKSITVNPADIENVTVTGLTGLAYTGSVITINPQVSFNSINLTNETDYTYQVFRNGSISEIIEQGEYTLLITAVNNSNFKDTKEVTFTVGKLDINDLSITTNEATYNAENQIPTVTVKNGETVISSDNYSVSYDYSEFINAGTYVLTITTTGNLEGTKEVEYIIKQLDISNTTASYDTQQYFTNSQITPEIILTYKGNTLTSADYTVTYGENIEVGQGSITVNALSTSNYTGTKTYYFDIIKESLEEVEVTGYESTIKYTGVQYTPTITVKLNGSTLTLGTDYNVEYGTNVDAGTTTFIKVIGTGIYSGEKEIVVSIEKADITGISFDDQSYQYNGTSHKLEINGTLPNGVTVEYYLGNDVFEGATTVNVYEITAKFTVNTNYNELDDMTATLEIYKAVYDMSNVKLSSNSVEYDAQLHKLEIEGQLPQGVQVAYYLNETLFNGIKNQGTYTIVAKFTGDSTNYELIDDMSATLTITKATPVITINNVEYKVNYNSTLGLSSNYSISNNPDNIAEVILITNSNGDNVTDEPLLNAGTYTVTITINGNDNVNTVSESFTLIINKIDPTYTVPTGLTGIYGKELQTISLPDGWTFVSPTDVMSNIGDYPTSIKFTPDDELNYNVITKEVVIDVKKATISGISFSNKEVTYNGDTQTISITGALPDGVNVLYYHNDELFTGAIKAGEYNIVAKFEDTTNNYEQISDMNAILTIKKASYDMSGIEFINKEVDYDGYTHNVTVTGTLPEDLGVEYYIEDVKFTGAVDAGTYVVTVKFSDTSDGGENYVLPANSTLTLTIKQIMDPSYAEQGNLTANYGQTLANLTAMLVEGWSFKDELTTLVGDAGNNTFTVEFTPSDTTNYKTITKDIIITVSSINPTFTVENNTYVYDGQAHYASVSSVSSGTISITYKLNETVIVNPTNVGNYDIYVSITETTNYNELVDYKLDQQLVISKYVVTDENSIISSILDQSYTGSAIEPLVSVTLTEDIPFDSSCYTVSYSNNTDRGQATVTITMNGNFEGTLTTTFNIIQGAITNESITPISDRPYTGSETIYELVVTVSGKQLVLGDDYTVVVNGDTTNAGSVTITVTGTGNYSGTGTVSFEITQIDITTCKEIIIPNQIYLTDGNKPLPTIEIDGFGTLINESDYTLSYSNNIGVTNNASVIITGTGNYTGSITSTFTIVAKDITDVLVELESSIIYTGNDIEAIKSVTLAGYEDLTYDITYSNNVNAGNTASYTITGTGNFAGTVTNKFTIDQFDLATLADEDIELIGSLVYTSKQITPTVEITFNSGILENTTYSLSYGDNINVADGGTITISAVSTNFKGTKSVTFEIEQRSIDDAVATVSDQAYTGNAITPVPTVTIEGIGILINNTDFTLSYSENNTNVSDSPVTITVSGTGNYTGTLESTFNITPIDISGANVSKIADVYYTGNAIEPTPVITVEDFGVLDGENDYTVTYSNNTVVGVATITINGKGNFTGEVSTTFNIIDSIASATVYFGELTQPSDQIYTGNKYEPTVTIVIINGVELVENTHYKVSYGNNTNAGTGHVYITAVEGSGYDGAKDITFNIAQATQTINYQDINEVYSGNPYTITATSSIDTPINYYDEDGNVFTGATNVGTYNVTIIASGNENYEEAKVTATITITPFDIDNLVVGTNIIGFKDIVVYTGNPIVQDLTIKFNNSSINELLTIVQNNQDPTDNAKIYITVNAGVTNFTGTKELTYKVDKAEQSITVEQETITVEYGTDYEVQYTILGDGEVTILYYNGEELLGTDKPVNVGNYRAVINVAEGTYYYGGTKEVQITINGINPTITITKDEFDYNAEGHEIEYSTNSTGLVTIVYTNSKGVVVDKPISVDVYTVSITQQAAGNYLEHTISGTVTIKAIQPIISISNLVDGKMTFAYLEAFEINDYITITNNPDGLTSEITYNGLSTAPTVPGSYSVVVKVAATDNTLESVANFTLVIEKIEATYSGNTEFTATYGDKLSSITLPEGLTWNNPDDLVGNVTVDGHTHYATYNPNADLYEAIEVAMTVKVTKATPVYEGEAVVLEAYYGQKLADITEDLPTHFSWKDDTLSVGSADTTGSFTAYYNPDSANYDNLEVTVQVKVNKAQAEYTGSEITLTAVYGQTLADISAKLPTYFSWVDDALSVGNANTTGSFKAYYNPDSNNYISDEVTVKVTVSKATEAYNGSTEITTTYVNRQKLSDLTLPDSKLRWADGTKEVGNATTEGYTFTAYYNPDNANYNDYEVTITVKVNKADLSTISIVGKSVDYNGNVQSLILSTTLPSDLGVTFVNNEQTNSGTYTVTATITGSIDNYILPDKLEATLQINRISPTVSNFENLNVSLGDEYNIIPSVLGINGETVNYEIKYYDSSNNLLSSAPTVNGTYTVKLIVNETNYVYNGSIELTISNPIKIVVTGTGDSGVDYDGNEHEASIAVYNSNDENITTNILSVLTITYTKGDVNYVTPVDAGKYSVVVTCTDNINYTITPDSITEATIIINKLNVKIDFEYDSSGSDYRYKSKEYTGSVLSLDYTISGISENLIASDFVVRIYNGNNAVVDIDSVLSIDTYRYEVEFNETNYNLSGYSIGILAITKAKIKLSNTVIEIAYGEITHSYEKLFVKVEELLSFVMYNDNTKSVVIDAVLNNINDGKNVYTSSTTTSLIGNTYSGSISFTSSIYQLVDESGNAMNSGDSNSINIIVKYKTAIGGDGNYYTIEDAIKNESGTIGDIRLQGSTSGYIMTSFTNISYYDSSYYTLTDARTLRVSADNSTSEILSAGTSLVYSVLNIPSGVTFTLDGSSALVACGALAHGTVTSTRGVIMNDGLIIVNSGEIRSYGYIKSSSKDSDGLIFMNSGTSATDCMRVFDWPGGNTATNISSSVLPTNAWSIHNISCKMELHDAAILKVHAYIEVSLITINESYPIINGVDSGNPLFVYDQAGSYITKYSENSNASQSSTELYTITGNNQDRGQKDIIELNGSYKDNTFKISKSGYSMATSTSVPCPIGFMHVNIKTGTLSLSKSDYLFNPGTSLTISEGATLNVGKGVDLSFESIANVNKVTSNGWERSNVFTKYCVDKEDAKLILSGNIVINGGSIGGLIVPGKSGVNLDLTGKDITTTFISLKHAIGTGKSGYPCYKITDLSAAGFVTTSSDTVNDIKCALTQSSYTSVNINGKYYWVGSRGSENDTTINGSISESNKISACITAGTLITMADGTLKKIEDIMPGDRIKIYNHETGKIEYSSITFIDHMDLDKSLYVVLNLQFNNNTILRVVGSHGLFDLTINKYVYIDSNNVNEYIGHEFYSIDEKGNGKVLELTNYYITEEEVKVFSPVSVYHMNVFANGLLTVTPMPNSISGFVNIFEYGHDLQFNQELMQQDIDKYGLFTYEDVKEYVTLEEFENSQIKYLKVSLGKGYITEEEIIKLLTSQR